MNKPGGNMQNLTTKPQLVPCLFLQTLNNGDGTLALISLHSFLYPTPFVPPDSPSTPYAIIIAGANFGCGSSSEHAPVALGAAVAHAVVAESYVRIFFRNSVATVEIYPLETETVGLYRECTTGARRKPANQSHHRKGVQAEADRRCRARHRGWRDLCVRDENGHDCFIPIRIEFEGFQDN